MDHHLPGSDGSDADAPWIAEASPTESLELPTRPRPRCREARRALLWAILGVVCLGFVFGPLALALGQKARLAIAEDPGLGDARTARAAIALGKVGLALHLTLAMAALPWLLFAMPLVGSLGG
jgi:hypothetical protein